MKRNSLPAEVSAPMVPNFTKHFYGVLQKCWTFYELIRLDKIFGNKCAVECLVKLVTELARLFSKKWAKAARSERYYLRHTEL